ncbi:MAG: PA2169 family four-helix-bundle protein [Sphingomicrobium sp.]
MTETSNDIRTLNGLIATTIDSVDGYRTSAEDIQSPELKQRFIDRASERETMVAGLRGQVSTLGGNPEDDGTILAGAHRMFVDLKSAVTGKDDKAVINEVERGEDHIKAKFKDALADDTLSAETREVIQVAWTSVKAGHNEMSSLKHSLESHA